MKKKSLLAILLILAAITAFAQSATTPLTSDQAKDLKNSGTEVKESLLKFGMSLGFNYLTSSINDPTLSVNDNTLKLQKIIPASFLLSTCVVINPIKAYYRKIDPS